MNNIRKFLGRNIHDVCTVMRIFCTLPITDASAERSFSKLKLIKNDSTISQGRLNDQRMLSIEAELFKAYQFPRLIYDLAAKKAPINFY